MANSWHVEWLKEGVAKWNIRRKRVEFTPDLSGLNFFKMHPPDYRDSPKTSRYFEKINLSGANLSGADLTRLNFQKADFSKADMSNSNMSKSNFNRAKFIDANLEGVTATQSIFDYAEFQGTNVRNAIFGESEAKAPILIATDFSRDQLEELGLSDVKVFASRAEYTFEMKQSAYISDRTQNVQPDGMIGFEKDERTAKNRYDVFFGTNRKPIIERGAIEGFTGNRDDATNFGLCEVIVPEGHRIGEIGTSLWQKLKNKQDDSLRLKNLISLNEKLFFVQLNATMDKMKDRRVPTVFIHGFNNSFEDSVLRAAQIGYDLGIGQGIGLFSWPSKGKLTPKGYSSDEASAEASKYMLADFIERFVNNVPDKGINIIAHSMGCRCLLGAFEVLAIDRKNILRAINQTILAAADVDAGSMSRLGQHSVKNSKRTTSYVSDKDIALKTSGWIHSFPRVGLSPPIYIMNQMDTVLVNDHDLGIAKHGYISSSSRVLGDIFRILDDDVSPDRRFGMQKMTLGVSNYWQFKN